jgi:hypothetical protein
MGTLKTTNIQTITGSGTLTLGTSGETVTVPSGVTVSGSMANTPAFSLYGSGSNQSVTNSAVSTADLTGAYFDTHSGFDNTNNRWTVPSGGAGKYILGALLGTFTASNNNSTSIIYLTVNGSIIAQNQNSDTSGGQRHMEFGISILYDLSVGDYVELKGYSEGTSPQFRRDGNSMRLWGCRIIGA